MSSPIACLECDLIVGIGDLAPGERAMCPRCGHLLSRCVRDSYERGMAFAISALVFLVIANSFPFLAFERSGFESVMTLPSSAMELYRYGYLGLAVLVFGFIIVVPAVYLALLLAVLVPLARGLHVPWLVRAGKALYRLAPWSMVEVFVIGVLVSLVKIAAMATVVMGISFWAYIAFALCFTAALASVDRLATWDRIEMLSHG